MAPLGFKMFPKNHVWVPTTDGKFCHRPVTAADEKRRALVEELLTRPAMPKGARLSETMETLIAERKVQIREELAQIPAPYEIEA